MLQLSGQFPHAFHRSGERKAARRARSRRRGLGFEQLEDRWLLTVAFGLGTAGQEYGKAMTIDPSGDVLVAMLFQNTLDFDPGPGTTIAGSPPGIDLALVKYHPDGTLGWVKAISTTNPTAALVTPHGVETDAAGNVFVIGYFGLLNAANTNALSADFDPGPGTTLLTNTGGADPFLIKFDPNGNLLWARTIGNTTASMTEERAWDLAVDASGAVYVSGFLNGKYDLDAGAGQSLYTSAGGTDAFLVKYDASGNYSWGFGVGGTGADDGLAVALDGAGNVFLQGTFSGTVDLDPSGGTFNVTSAGGTDIFLAKYDANTGTFQTGFRIGGTLNEASPPGTLRLSPGGDLLFSGRFRGTVDLNPGTGVNSVSNMSTADNIFVAGYTPALAFRLGFSLPSDGGLDGAHRVGFDPSGNIILTGWHSGTTDFDPGAGTFTLVSSNAAAGNASDMFLAKYTSSGEFLWADQFGGPVAVQTQLSIVAGLAVDHNGNSYITGQTYGVTDFDPGFGTANYTPVGLNDAFLAMYDPLGNLADNAAPTAAPQTRSTNAGTPATLTLGGDDGDPEVVQTLTYAIAADPGHGTLTGFNSATGQVTYTPTAGFTGTDTFTFAVTDDMFAGGPSRTSPAATVTINVVGTKDPPTISDIADQATNEDTATAAIAFTVDDLETPAASLTITATSSNTTLVPNANILLGGSGANRTLMIAPAANQFGTATITVTVTDADGEAASDTFALTVNARQYPWQNPVNHFDVNADGSVSPLDVLLIINELNKGGTRQLEVLPNPDDMFPFLDASADGFVAPLDALVVINFLNLAAVGLPGEGEGGSGCCLENVLDEIAPDIAKARNRPSLSRTTRLQVRQPGLFKPAAQAKQSHGMSFACASGFNARRLGKIAATRLHHAAGNDKCRPHE